MAHLDVVRLGHARSAFRTGACRIPVVRSEARPVPATRTDAPLVLASRAEACPVPVVAVAQIAVRGRLACLTVPMHFPFLLSRTPHFPVSKQRKDLNNKNWAAWALGVSRYSRNPISCISYSNISPKTRSGHKAS